ncbi:MAG: hypothetical protein F6K28_58455, partial [Microcoleus sp. SIO2G3]|nr:hypothetical protein [Microcoleus sp. SIO2G3]
MTTQIVENLELFSETEQEALEFLLEELENIESELYPELESISPEKVSKDLEVYFQGNIEEVGLERGVSAGINVNVDVLAIAKSIKSSIKSAKNRGGFVK